MNRRLLLISSLLYMLTISVPASAQDQRRGCFAAGDCHAGSYLLGGFLGAAAGALIGAAIGADSAGSSESEIIGLCAGGVVGAPSGALIGLTIVLISDIFIQPPQNMSQTSSRAMPTSPSQRVGFTFTF